MRAIGMSVWAGMMVAVVAVVLAVMPLEVRAERADGGTIYQSTSGSWTVRLPAGWKVMPAEMFKAINAGAGALSEQVGQSTKYAAGFFTGNPISGDWSWVLVQEEMYPRAGALPEDLTEILKVEQFTGELAKMESAGLKMVVLSSIVDAVRGKLVFDSQLDIAASGERVRGRTLIMLGARSSLAVHGYSAPDHWDRYERSITELQGSAAFVGANDISAAQRVSGGAGFSITRMLVVGLLGGVVAVIVRYASKLFVKQGDPGVLK